MGKLIKRIYRTICVATIFIAVFVLAAFVEGASRSLALKSIPITVADNVRAEVKADVQPDIFWIGQAWAVNISCDAPVSLDFDGRWKALVPAGKHTIYHNHDSNNTRTYSRNYCWETPAVITVREP